MKFTYYDYELTRFWFRERWTNENVNNQAVVCQLLTLAKLRSY